MVQVSVGNTPVSVALADGESVTVPTGEMWDVQIGTDNGIITIDGNQIGNSTDYGNGNRSFTAVLPEGTTVTVNGGTGAISGFRV